MSRLKIMFLLIALSVLTRCAHASRTNLPSVVRQAVMIDTNFAIVAPTNMPVATFLQVNGIAAETNLVDLSNRVDVVEARTNTWELTYAWGNHGTNGYLTQESDTMQSVANRGSTVTNQLNLWGGVALDYSDLSSVNAVRAGANGGVDVNARNLYGLLGDQWTMNGTNILTWPTRDPVTNYFQRTGGTISGNLDLGGNTASNGTFSGTHTGDGSGLTGLPSGGSDGYWTNDVDNAHPGGTAVLTGTSSTNLHWTPVASSAFVGFHAYQTNDSWTATRIVWTTVIHPQESYDPYNLHDTTTGAFRPNTSGVWQIGAFVMPDDQSWTASGGNAYFRLFSNTTGVATLEVYRWTTAYGPRNTAPAVYEDYFDSGTDYYLKFYHDDSASRPMQGAKSDCYFWGSLKGVLP